MRFQPTTDSPSLQKVSRSNPHPPFSNCIQNDVTLVPQKTIIYYCPAFWKVTFTSERLTICGCEIRQGVVTLLLVHQVLEHGQVVVEGSDVQHADDDVSQVVRVQHLKNIWNNYSGDPLMLKCMRTYSPYLQVNMWQIWYVATLVTCYAVTLAGIPKPISLRIILHLLISRCL